MRKVKYGCPGFIWREELAKDFAGTCKKIKEIGFDGIEITGFFGKSAEEIHAATAEIGLEPFGCFVMPNDLLCEEAVIPIGNWEELRETIGIPGNTPEEKIQYLKKIGCSYIGLAVSSDAPNDLVFEQISRAAKLAEKHGMKLQYHNHDYEYNNMIYGKYRMDLTFEKVSENILFEPDLGWIGIGGCDPMKALEKYCDRIEIVHLKDYYREGKDKYNPEKEYIFRPTGYGIMDWASILTYCEEKIRPLWYVADHDKSYNGEIYDEMKLSLDYIKKQLLYICGSDC